MSRKLGRKARKHDEIRVLAESTLNNVADLVSAALQDGKLSDVEFCLVVDEVAKYRQLKKELRTAGPAETEKSLIQ